MADKMSVPPSDGHLSAADKAVIKDEKAAQIRDGMIPVNEAARMQRDRMLAVVEDAYLYASKANCPTDQATKRVFWQRMKDSVWTDING